jgi:hypothetical protein
MPASLYGQCFQVEWGAILNIVFHFDRWLQKHGANDNHLKKDPDTGKLVPGRMPDPDENYLVVEKGDAFPIWKTRELHQYYVKKGLPWMYGMCY